MSQDTTQALSQFDHAFAAALEHNRALMESAANFLRDESFRFFTLRLDRTRQTMDQLGECRGVPGLLSVQKDWLEGWIADVNGQAQRASEFWQQNAERIRTEMHLGNTYKMHPHVGRDIARGKTQSLKYMTFGLDGATHRKFGHTDKAMSSSEIAIER